MASSMELGQARERVFDRPVRSVAAMFVIERAAILDPLQQVDVGAGVGWRTQRRHQRNLVGRVLDRAQTGQQVANLLSSEHELARLEPVRHAQILERALQLAQVRARRQEDADIPVAGWPQYPCTAGIAIADLPAVLDGTASHPGQGLRLRLGAHPRTRQSVRRCGTRHMRMPARVGAPMSASQRHVLRLDPRPACMWRSKWWLTQSSTGLTERKLWLRRSLASFRRSSRSS